MKNIIKNPIFTFIIGIVIASSSVVIASNLISSQIGYTPKDSSWGVNNVEAAIDSLKLSKTSDNYSTTEKVVGTWIDGKPVYQKTYDITFNSSQDVNIDNTLTKNNIIPIDTEGYIKIDNGNYINVGYAGGVNFIIQEDGFHCNTSGKYNIVDVYVTIQYTKTTDQPTN